MKRIWSIILVAIICLSLCSCGSSGRQQGKSFDSVESLLSSITGMWLVDDSDKEEFYVFLDGNIYRTNHAAYEYEIERLLDETLQTKGLGAWRSMDFQASFVELDYQDVLREPLTGVSFQPKKGTIVLDEGKSWEKTLIVSDTGIVLVEGDSEFGVDLIKIADLPTFFGEEFEEIFTRVKMETTVPKSMLLPTVKDYGELLQNAHGQVREWPVVSRTDDSLIKSLDGTLESNFGSFVLTDSMVTLGLGARGAEGNPYVLVYNTLGTGADLVIRDKLFYDLKTALSFVTPVVQNIPNSLTGEELHDLFMQERVLADGVYQFKKTIGSVTYQIYNGASWPNLYVTIIVSVEDTIPLADSLDTPNTDKPELPDNSGTQTETRPTTVPQPTTEPKPDIPTETEPEVSTAGPMPSEPTLCDHNYAAATCTTPKTCTICGVTAGDATGHDWKKATCTQPKTCTICGETIGDVVDHIWKEATCTEPATCTVCKKTSGMPKGHELNYTQCWDCDYSDFSCIAKNYTDISCYDGKTGEDYEVENVSISTSGVLAFTFKGAKHLLVLKQSGGDAWEVTFDCYENGTLVHDAQVRANESSKGTLVHLSWKNLDGCYLYFCLFG